MSVFAKGTAAAVIWCALSGVNAAVSQDGVAIDNLTVAQSFINAAFPDLRGRKLQADVSLGGEFGQDWHRWGRGSISLHAHQTDSRTHSKEILSGRFIFVSGRVREAHFEGELVSSPLTTKVAMDVTIHKGWTASNMVGAFSKAGARFATLTESEFLRQIDLRRFEKVVGPVVRSTASFVAEPPYRVPELDDKFVPFWLVRIETKAGPQVSRRYKLEFEPFNAQLITIIELTESQR
jgi:hypothetical protein